MKRLYIIPLLSLLFVSCDKGDDLVGGGELTASTPIAIEVSQKAITRGAMVNDESTMGSVGLYCAYTGSSDWSSTTDYTNRMYNVNYTYDKGKWSSNDAVAWGHTSITDKFSFNAYSPFAKIENGITPSIAEGELSVGFTMPTDCANQPDLMVATPRKNIYPQTGGSVHLEFNHMLAAIGFKLKGETTMKLLSVTINSLPSTSTLTNDGTSFVWSAPTDSKDFAAGITATSPKFETTADLVTTPTGYILAIPQTPTSETTVYITYCPTSDESNVLNKSLPLPAGTVWKASHQYLYAIILEGEIKLVIDDWSEVSPEDSITGNENGYDVGNYDSDKDITDSI